MTSHNVSVTDHRCNTSQITAERRPSSFSSSKMISELNSMNCSVERVDFTPSSYSLHDIRYQIPALMTNTSAKVLSLPLDRLDMASVKCIMMILENEFVGPQLEELRLSHIPRNEDDASDGEVRSHAGGNACESFLQILSSFKQNTTHVKKLVVSETPLSHSEVSGISSALYGIANLKSLVLRECEIDYKGATKLSCALVSNTSLESLDISNNPIGNRGASALAVALDINSNIKKLKLSGTGLGLEGGKAVASMLNNNSSLEVLDLSRNSLGDVGVSKIAVSLKSNTTLRQLSLRQNSFSDIGALCILLALFDTKCLMSLLRCNHNLRYLNLGNNGVGDEYNRKIELALQSNTRSTENETIRYKIASYVLSKSAECTTSSFGCMKLKYMPHFLSALGVTHNLSALYLVIKNVNMPLMFEKKSYSCSGMISSSPGDGENVDMSVSACNVGYLIPHSTQLNVSNGVFS